MEKISRTQKKKAAQGLKKIGERLVALNEGQLQAMGLSADLYEAVTLAQKLSRHEARRRQMQYIGRLMREVEVDAGAIESALDQISQQDVLNVRRFKQVEQWRDELSAGNDALIETLLDRFADLDRRHLTKLVADARAASAGKNRKKAGRALFRYLRQFE